MILGETALNAFINANILFIVAFAIWKIARFVLRLLGLKHAYSTQLTLLNTVFMGIILSPFLIFIITALQKNGIGPNINVNLSDNVVAFYLKGGLEMRATDFEQLMSTRNTFTSNILHLDTWGAITVVIIFIAGFVIGLTRLSRSIFFLTQIVSTSYAWRSFGKVRIRLSDRTLVPFSTRGFRNYYVIIPSNMLGNSEQIKVSLAHEFQHLRQWDIEWEILLEALKPFFFLNPAYHAWKRQVEDLRELACDSNVLTSGRVKINAYCDTLLSVCQQSLRRDRVFVVAVPKVTLVTADRSIMRAGKIPFLEHRIMTLFDARPINYPKLVYALIALPLMAAIILITMAIQAPDDWSQDRLMLSSVVNLERLDEINRLTMLGRIRN